MRLFLSVFLFVFFVSSLNAEYLRTIRIGSFVKEKDAQESLLILQEFAKNHENIVSLQQENEFIFKARKSGSYYITIAEPFMQRAVLQEVLDTLREEYDGVYVTKLKSKPIYQKKLAVTPIIEPIELEEKVFKPKKQIIKKPITENIKIDVSEVVEYNKPEVLKIEESVEPQKLIENTDIDVVIPKVLEEKASLDYLWQLLFFVTFVFLLIVIRSRYKYKKDNEVYINQEMINSEKLEQTIIEMKTKEKFLSHASHELRTPMTAILGLTHLVLENDLSTSQKDYVQRIEGSAKHLLNIVNDILDISKLQASELKIEKIEFNINDILEYVLNVISIQAKNNNINISMDIDSNIPSHVVGDSLRLGQVLINLLANAVKFTKDGDVTLNVKKLSSFGDTIKVEFSIVDTGIGMTQQQVENIFQSYTQANDSTSRKFGGTGLGLSISKQLVELMNGEIKVHSKKDAGSTFTFSIQFSLNDSQNKRQYRLPTSGLLGKKILIVDSSNKNVIPLIRALGYFKYKTHSIPSFEEAILENEMKYDIIIINQVNLTRFAVDQIKSIQNRDDSKIVVLSELYSSLNSDLLEDFKIDHYLKTPFTQQNILNMIVELYVVHNLNSRSRKISIKDKLKKFTDKKILIVEDNVLNHKVIAGLLSQTGIALTFATDGQEAVDLVLKGMNFDVVLMDINMPIMDGYEASREIRKHKQYNSLPILALTADVMDDSIQKALACGMQGHIAKPIIVDIFYKKIIDAFTTEPKYPDGQVAEKPKTSDEFEEISIGMGLGRCDNDEIFYKSILKDFKVMYINSSVTLEELCRTGKFKEARSMAMDIKDVSLNIGAYNLCENAATMEYEFEKGDRCKWQRLVEFYTISLDKLFKDIDKYLKKV